MYLISRNKFSRIAATVGSAKVQLKKLYNTPAIEFYLDGPLTERMYKMAIRKQIAIIGRDNITYIAHIKDYEHWIIRLKRFPV